MKILMGIIFALVPSLCVGILAWFLFYSLTAGVIAGVGMFLFGLDVNFRGTDNG